MKYEPVADPDYGSVLEKSVRAAFIRLGTELKWMNFCMWAIDRRWQG